MLGNWPRFFKVEGGWVGLSRVITGGAQLNGLVGWQGPQPVPTSATQLGTLLMATGADVTDVKIGDLLACAVVVDKVQDL